MLFFVGKGGALPCTNLHVNWAACVLGLDRFAWELLDCMLEQRTVALWDYCVFGTACCKHRADVPRGNSFGLLPKPLHAARIKELLVRCILKQRQRPALAG